MKKIIFLTLPLTLSSKIWALPQDMAIKEAPELNYEAINIHHSSSYWQDTPKSSSEPRKIKAEQLRYAPELLQRVINIAVQQEHIPLLTKILPIYETSANPSPIIIAYAKGLIAKSTQQYPLAINQFTKVEKLQPNSEKAIFHHIDSLLLDQQIWLASKLVQQHLSTPSLPFRLQLEKIDQYLQSRKEWKYYLRIEFLNDKNINNAPDKAKVGSFSFEKPLADKGLSYQFGNQKTFFMPNGFYTQWQTDFIGKIYRTYHQYNDFYGRITIPFGYANYHHQFTLEPYTGLRIFAEKPYTNHFGITTSWQYQWTNNFRSKIAFNYATERYRQKQYKHLTNYTQNLSLSGTWTINSKWYAGISAEIGKKYATDYPQDRYIKYRANINLGYQNQNIGARLRLAREQKNYKAPFYWGLSGNAKRQDRETQFSASIWSPHIQFMGIMPTLGYNYQRVNSNSLNIPYHKHSITFEIQKIF
ncbi:surface lipoprotein assembly modifier [Avibacterium avium]|uniref:TPR repeat-containing protein NMB0313 n=1 Tax=Avibacterium avium TaxID=751 RepID=A0A379AU31_AVIAV|nr:surface lipoprotein assembly modifier [Avibacterium avium]SUB24831.1 TPR repeat-containing protein NMB0313 precursor [Avibacterium avium]